MFIVIMAVAALADYVITFCCIVNMVAKPAVETEETPKAVSEGYQTMDNAVGHLSDDEEFNRYIEEQNARIALLSFNIDKILSNIDSIVEGNKAEQVVL